MSLVLMGMILTLPISSAALAIILNLSGLAGGAATVGCCANMVGFAVASFKENGISGLISQGFGTSMLQVPNIMKKPIIWIPAIIASAILGPISTVVLHMTNNASGAGMGTAGLDILVAAKKETGLPIVSELMSADYIDEFAKTKLNARTVDIYIQTKNKIQKFDSDCKFEDIDRAWLTKFERWMIDSGMKTNACAVHMRNIRAVFNYCIDEEYTTLYPFRKFKIKKEETRKRSLTVEQLRTLRDYPCEEYQVRYRDIFMLMFYMIGINAIDLFHAKDSDVVDGRLEYKRSKTGKLYSVLIQPEAQAIIDKYRGKNYLLNVLDEYKNYKDFLHRMGDALKDIGPMERKGLGGKKIRQPLFPDISSYWARHTWATIAASLDIPKEVISAGLGHEIGSSITSIYIDFNMKKVDDANRAVIDYVNKE